MQPLALLDKAIKLVLAAASASFVFSQTPFSPASTGFEVATVKPNAGSDARAFLQAVQADS